MLDRAHPEVVPISLQAPGAAATAALAGFANSSHLARKVRARMRASYTLLTLDAPAHTWRGAWSPPPGQDHEHSFTLSAQLYALADKARALWSGE